jgi:hypothetical protein
MKLIITEPPTPVEVTVYPYYARFAGTSETLFMFTGPGKAVCLDSGSMKSWSDGDIIDNLAESEFLRLPPTVSNQDNGAAMSRPKIDRDNLSQFGRQVDPMAGVDLEAEYKKVMAKTSKLTAKQRRYVVAHHNYMLAKAEEEK